MKVTSFNLAEEAQAEVSRTLLWLQTCPFSLGLAQQKGVKIVPTIWGRNSSYSNVLGTPLVLPLVSPKLE